MILIRFRKKASLQAARFLNSRTACRIGFLSDHGLYERFQILISTQYYWQVVARDDGGITRDGAVWRFETEAVASEQVIFGDGFE